jgi:hypothetical protein
MLRRHALILVGGMASVAAHATPATPALKLFPDAPPPPVVLGLPDFCCTATGRLAFVNPAADGVTRLEGQACVVQADNQPTLPGKACF